MNTTILANVSNVTIETTPSPTTLLQKLGYHVPTTAEFTTQLKISIPISIGLIIFYCIVRKMFPHTFELRKKLSQNLISGNDQNEDEDADFDMETKEYDLKKEKQPITFPTLSSTYFTWMYDVWMIDDQIFYSHAGFDALVFRLYLKGCVYICLVSLPYALLILLPVYGTSKLHGGWLDEISLNTVREGSNRLYAAVVGSYIFSFIALYYLSKVYLAVAYATDQFLIGSKQLNDISDISWFNYKKAINNVIDFNINLAKKPMDIVGDIYAKGHKLINKQQITEIRLSQFSNSNSARNIEMDSMEEHKMMNIDEDNEISTSTKIASVTITDEEKYAMIPPIDRYTVMMRNLPKQFRDENTLKQFMEQLFPNKIARVVVVPNVSELTAIHKQIRNHQNKLIKLSEKHDFSLNDLYDNNKLPEILEGTKCCGCCGDKINLIQYHKRNKDALIAKFIKTKKHGLPATPTAFIIFKSLTQAANCISSPIRFGLTTLKVSKAPYPNDLYWTNLKFKKNDLIVNNFLVAIAVFLLLIFWSIPVVAIQALANLDAVFAFFGGNAHETLGGKERVASLQGALTVLILDLWLGILPIICEILTFIQRKAYRGRHEMLVMTKYFDCLVFMVLLVTVVSGSIISGGNDLADYAQNIVGSMSGIIETLADGLSRMSTYFLLYVLLNAFLWLPFELFRPGYFIMNKLKIPEANRFHYSVWYAKTMLILSILLTYSVMNPIMWIFGLVYFIFATFVFTYNLSMSWLPEFETGAKQWPLVFGRIRFAFLISIFTLIGLMTFKKKYVCAALLLPLAGFIWFITGNINVKFRTIFRVTSLTSARQKDKQITKFVNNGNVNSSKHLGDNIKLKYIYLPPIMAVNYTKDKSIYSPPQLQTL